LIADKSIFKLENPIFFRFPVFCFTRGNSMRLGFFLALTVFFSLALFSSMVFALESCKGGTPNGVCESPILGGNENSCTCPSDCGSCAPAPLEVCQNYFCDSNNVCRSETMSDCCGNGICEPPSERTETCSQDCVPGLKLELVSPSQETPFMRGEKVPVVVSVISSGQAVSNARLRASGFFGTVELFNDGLHGDGTDSDNVYGNWVTVPVTAPEGLLSASVEGDFAGDHAALDFFVLVKPELSYSLEFPALVFLGNNFLVSGNVQAGSRPVVLSFEFHLSDPSGKVIEKKEITTSANGSFSYSYRTSLIDPTGEWALDANGFDANNNRFSLSKTVLVEDPGRERSLGIDYASDKITVGKGETVSFVVTVTDFNFPVSDASVELVDPLGNNFPLSFLSDGKYGFSYRAPFELPAGQQSFRFQARRSTGITVKGTKEFVFPIEGKPFSMELLLPTEKKFSIGDSVRFRVRAEYAPAQPVLDANAFVLINGKRVPLASEGGGFYSGEYLLEETDAGSLPFEAVVADRFENRSSATGSVEAIGFGFLFFVQRFGAIVLVIAVILLTFFWFLHRSMNKSLLIQKLEKRKNELLELEKNIQVKYFELASMEKTEFEKFMALYENELKEVEKKLVKLKKTVPGMHADQPEQGERNP
jgi:hypothetical protein